MKSRINIISTGSYLPEKILTNQDLSEIVETSDEWITSRTGIKQRHIAAENEFTSDLAYKAATNALAKSHLTALEIDLIIIATTTPDYTFPSTANILQSKLGAKNALCFDIQSVCAGFLNALIVADSLMKNNDKMNNALVIGAETMSKILNWQDRTTCVLFGDGAGAVILSKNHNDSKGLIDCHMQSDGDKCDILKTSGGVSRTKNAGFILMDGPQVFKNAVSGMYKSVDNLLSKNNIAKESVNLYVSHQANIRILEAIADKMQVSSDSFHITVDKHANTSAASIPLALDDAFSKNRIKTGDIIVLTAFGAGLTWGSAIIEF